MPMDGTLLYRKVVLSVAGNALVSGAAKRVGMKLGASRFVAGERMEQALAVAKELNQRSVLVTLDYLGEGVTDEDLARKTCLAYLALLDGISASRVDGNVSVKPTQLGLSFSRPLTEELLQRIVQHARERKNFVRIDMENTPYTEATIDILLQLHKFGYKNVGTVIQSYLYRSASDIKVLNQVGANLRIVKGAYQEPPELAYPRKAEVDEAYRRILSDRLRGGCYTAVATHDARLVDFTKELVEREGIPRDRFEFQMLFGVRMEWQEQLAREGYKVRCYLPFGEMWYPYFTRRIAERPGNAWFVLRNLIRGKG